MSKFLNYIQSVYYFFLNLIIIARNIRYTIIQERKKRKYFLKFIDYAFNIAGDIMEILQFIKIIENKIYLIESRKKKFRAYRLLFVNKTKKKKSH